MYLSLLAFERWRWKSRKRARLKLKKSRSGLAFGYSCFCWFSCGNLTRTLDECTPFIEQREATNPHREHPALVSLGIITPSAAQDEG